MHDICILRIELISLVKSLDCCIIIILALFSDISPLSVVLALIMIQAQVVRRFLECVFVSSYSKSTMSLVIYSAGVAFYSLLGISVLCQAPETKIELGKSYTFL